MSESQASADHLMSVESAAQAGRASWLRRHPGLAPWLLVLPGTIWMVLFVVVPLVSIVLFSFWKSGFAGLVPDYNVQNYRRSSPAAPSGASRSGPIRWS